MPKVTFIGAGSAVFARQLITDILAIDGLDEGVFALVDIDDERLAFDEMWEAERASLPAFY